MSDGTSGTYSDDSGYCSDGDSDSCSGDSVCSKSSDASQRCPAPPASPVMLSVERQEASLGPSQPPSINSAGPSVPANYSNASGYYSEDGSVCSDYPRSVPEVLTWTPSLDAMRQSFWATVLTHSPPQESPDPPATLAELCDTAEFDHDWPEIPSSRLLAQTTWEYHAEWPGGFLAEAARRVPREYIFPFALPLSPSTNSIDAEEMLVEIAARKMMGGFVKAPNVSVGCCLDVLCWIRENWVEASREGYAALKDEHSKFLATGYMMLVDCLACAIEAAWLTCQIPRDVSPWGVAGWGVAGLPGDARRWLHRVRHTMIQLWESRRRVRRLAAARMRKELAFAEFQKSSEVGGVSRLTGVFESGVLRWHETCAGYTSCQGNVLPRDSAEEQKKQEAKRTTRVALKKMRRSQQMANVRYLTAPSRKKRI